MKKYLLVFLLSALSNMLLAQLPDLRSYKTLPEKMKAIKAICDSLSYNEKYDQLDKVAIYTLTIIPANDLPVLSLYNYFRGVAHEQDMSRDTAIYFYEKSLDYALRSNTGKRIRTAYQRLLYLYHSAGNEDKMEHAAAELKNILDTTKNNKTRYEMMVFLGNYHNQKGEYEKNINYLLQSLDIQKKLLKEKANIDSSDVSITLLNIAKAYTDMQQQATGMNYILQARQYVSNCASCISYYYKNMTDGLIAESKPAKAIVYYDSLKTLLTKDNKDAASWADLIGLDLGFGDYYLKKNNNDSAAIFINHANLLAPKWASEYMLSLVNYMTGKLLFAKKDYAKALPLLLASTKYSREAGPETHAQLLQSLAQCYAATGQWQKAYEYYNLYAPVRDTLYTEGSKKSLAEAEAKYQNKEKQLQINEQEKEIAANRRQKIMLASALALFALVAILLAVIYRNKKRNADRLTLLNSQLEEANKTKAKLFSIISHDLRSPISQVYQFLKLQQLNPEMLDEKQRTALSNRIQNATGTLLETMEDLLIWSKTQMQEFKPSMESTSLFDASTQAASLLQLNADSKNIRIINNVQPADKAMTDPYYLQTLLRNILQNAVKASPENESISIDFKNNTISVSNKGQRFTQQDFDRALADADTGKSLTGLGLKIISELSQKTGIAVTYADVAEGCRADIYIPTV